MADETPCLACACTNPRLLSDVLGAIHLKRGQVRGRASAAYAASAAAHLRAGLPDRPSDPLTAAGAAPRVADGRMHRHACTGDPVCRGAVKLYAG